MKVEIDFMEISHLSYHMVWTICDIIVSKSLSVDEIVYSTYPSRPLIKRALFFWCLKMIKIKEKCFYWIDAWKITNYLSSQIRKKRPCICIYSNKINSIRYYYFVLGTSRSKSEIRAKNFTNYFFKVFPSNLNHLYKITNIQTNTIYVISEKDLNLFFTSNCFLGKISNPDWMIIKNFVIDAFNDGVNILSFYSSIYLRWFIYSYGKNFKYIGSRHRKLEIKNSLKYIIKRNLWVSQILVKNLNKLSSFLLNKLELDLKDFSKR